MHGSFPKSMQDDAMVHDAFQLHLSLKNIKVIKIADYIDGGGTMATASWADLIEDPW